MRYVWSALGAAGRLLTAFAWIALGLLVLALSQPALAQSWQGTRITPYDWACCADAECKTVISPHQREGKAQESCSNLVIADGVKRYVRSGVFEIAKPTTTPTVPVADTTPPSVPSNPQAQAVSSSEIRLTWGVAADNVGVTGYWIGRCVGAGCTSFAPLPVLTGLSYSDTGLSPSTTVRYRVRAVDAAGNKGLFGPIVEATTPARGGTALLSWTPPTTYTDGSALTDLSGYRILYSLGSTILDRMIDVPNPAVSSYVVEGLSPGTWYFAVLALTSSARISAKSNIVTKVVQ